MRRCVSGSSSSRRRVVAGRVAVAALAVVGTVAVSVGPAGAGGGNSILGTKDPAKGAPVKVGVISNGKSASLDNSDEGKVAKATAQWVNAYQGGLGGRPIEVVLCEDGNDPGKAADCANQMVREGVVAVVIGQNGVLEPSWKILNPAGIPVFIYGTGNPNITASPNATYNLVSPKSTLLGLPAGVAKKEKAKKVTAVVIDVPSATAIFEQQGPAYMKAQKLDYEVVTVPIGTADMTAQMQRLVTTNRDGVVMVIGNDAFCIAAFNGLRTAGFEGTVTTILQCITDATRTALPNGELKGIQISSYSPLTDTKNPAIKQYNAVLDTYGAKDVDRTNVVGMAMFNAFGAFAVAAHGVKGDVTPASVDAAIRSMTQSVAPGSGGLTFRCNGKVDPAEPSVCSYATHAAVLDAKGEPVKYVVVGNATIPD